MLLCKKRGVTSKAYAPSTVRNIPRFLFFLNSKVGIALVPVELAAIFSLLS
jgi:hypothetical protein